MLRLGAATREIGAADHDRALAVALEALGPAMEGPPAGVGHRVVHGGVRFDAPVVLHDDVLAELAALEPLAPLHQPHNLAAIRAARAAFPGALQVACFDTAFHRAQPWVADVYAIPRRYYDEGVRRYGFHGLSYEHVARHLAAERPALHAGRVVVAHLGHGASLCAMEGGRARGTTMGLSALDGLPMGTRCGQIDPDVLLYLPARGMSAAEVEAMLYGESGLKGLSGVGSDMRALLASDAPEAAEAVAHYVFRLRREVGAMAATLGGLDALVFTGGVGENATPIRERVCEGLGFLGVALDRAANEAGAEEIGAGPVAVLRLPTDEEGVIARAVLAAMGG